MFIINYKDINKNIKTTTMYIKCYNAETNQFIKTITEDELFEQCGKDQRMYDDFIRHVKSHPYVKPLNEYWKMVE